MVLVLWVLLRFTPYKLSLFASIRKVIAEVAVFQSAPDLRLFSQYPNEYNLKHPKGWIGNGSSLEIKSSLKTLWLGVWNNEPITIRGVRLILWTPKNIKPAEKEQWSGSWLFAQFGHEMTDQYEYREAATIYSGSGWVIAVPVTFEFPEVGTYLFRYAVLAEDWGAVEGSFAVNRVQ